MSDDTKAIPGLIQDPIKDAIDAVKIGGETLHELGTLFQAIIDASDQHSHVSNLAKIGHYLADDWGDALDCARENLAEIVGAREARP